MKRLSFLALFLLLAPAASGASVLVAMDLGHLCRNADVIVHGEVLRLQSAWEDGRIITRTTVRVAAALKGRPGNEVVVRSLGGVVGRTGQVAHGEARFAAGEELVLFLSDLGGEYRAVGMAQGKFEVTVEAGTGARTAVRDLSGLALARVQRGAVKHRGHGHRTRQSLDGLFSKIAFHVARSSAPAQ